MTETSPAYLVDGRLRFRVEAGPDGESTGEPIDQTVRLSLDGPWSALRLKGEGGRHAFILSGEPETTIVRERTSGRIGEKRVEATWVLRPVSLERLEAITRASLEVIALDESGLTVEMAATPRGLPLRLDVSLRRIRRLIQDRTVVASRIASGLIRTETLAGGRQRLFIAREALKAREALRPGVPYYLEIAVSPELEGDLAILDPRQSGGYTWPWAEPWVQRRLRFIPLP